MNIVLKIGLVVALLPKNGLFVEDYPWAEYIDKEVDEHFPTVDNIVSFVRELDSINLINKALPTESFETPKRWGTGFDAPYLVFLFQYLEPSNEVYGKCGGALLTENAVLTICSCVSSYILVLEGNEKPDVRRIELGEDLGERPLLAGFESVEYVFPTGEDLKKLISSPDTRRLVTEYKSEKPEWRKPQQCWYAFDKATKENKQVWLQRTTFAVLKFEPPYISARSNIFVPWPPQPIAYDLTLKDKGVGESTVLWGLHRAREPQTVSIPSFNYILHRFKFRRPSFKDKLGINISMRETLINFRTTMCDQDYCSVDFPDILKKYPDQETDNRRKYIGCFCDDNGADTVCQGLIGAPIVHDGNLYGMLNQIVLCNFKTLRTTIGVGLDPATIENIYNILVYIGETENKESFRSKTGIVDNYELEIPMADLMPQKLDLTVEDFPQGQSHSFSDRPSIILLMSFFVLLITCCLL